MADPMADAASLKTRSRTRSRRWKVGIVSVLFTAVFLYLLFTQVNLHDVLAAIAGASWKLVLFGFLLYCTSAYLRALRYRVLLQKRVPTRALFAAVTIQTMVINLIPNFIGEFSYLYLVKRLGGIRGGHAFASMVVARLFDLVAVFTLFLVFVFIPKDVSGFMLHVLWIMSLIIFVVLAIFLLLLFTKGRFCDALTRCFRTLRLTRIPMAALLLKKIREMSEALEETKSPRVLLSCFALSILIWLVSFTLAAVLIVASGYNLSFPIVAIGTAFSKLMSVLPVYGIAGFGTTEGFWSLGFMALGVDKGAAIVTGFGVHIFTLLYTLVLGTLFMVTNWSALFRVRK